MASNLAVNIWKFFQGEILISYENSTWKKFRNIKYMLQ